MFVINFSVYYFFMGPNMFAIIFKYKTFIIFIFNKSGQHKYNAKNKEC